MLQSPRFGETQPADPNAIWQQRVVGLVVMTVDDQGGTAGVGEGIDHCEAMRIAGWRFVGYQDVAAESGQTVEVLRENRIAVEQRQATAPSLAGSQGRLEGGTGAERWDGPLGRVPDPWLKETRQSGDAESADGGYTQTEIAGGGSEIVVGRFGFGVVVAEDPIDIPPLPD